MAFDLIGEAQRLATNAHAGVFDKGKRPYIAHPARVAARVQAYGPSYVAVAWLHDVVEDTKMTLEALRKHGFPDDVVAGVEAMTKRTGEEHPDAVARACLDDIACVVKAADVADNGDPARLVLIGDVAKREELTLKYARAREILDEFGAPRFDESRRAT